MNEKKVKLNQSVIKTFTIIESFTSAKQEMSLVEIAQAVELPKSTILRFLYTLMTLGYIEQNRENQQYSLSKKFEVISANLISSENLIQLTQPVLYRLSSLLAEATCLSVRAGDQLEYINSIDSQERILSITQKIGKRAPLYCTGAGKLFLSTFPKEELERYFETVELQPFTPNTITDKQQLLTEIQQVKKQQFAVDNEECELGVFCIATPILNSANQTIAAISVSIPTIRISEEKIKTVLNLSKQEIATIN
ncbi:hypothetical protein A5821_000947 [Enterococcus sp. 7F3_DIV0205]|uniref:IclR family transcriptional regulator n=1 Tax=Candidatus Enterococcus palustris TaxID=1834189 RepID=A0AAQ3W7Z9_9ENTE|nr:IclR family transcriptional regulator [Enterococcus sp. 7F3_DIV0205]OTN85345.1 hypothetical protein A5821_001290 [Enterococcus sp. 7F3_DIV0205]